MRKQNRPDNHPVKQAIRWMIEYDSGEMDPQRLSELRAWLDASPANEEAWETLRSGLSPFDLAAQQKLPPRALSRKVLEEPYNRRSVLSAFVGTAAIGGASAAGLNQFVPLEFLLNDKVTHTGEQADLVLADGAHVTLAPRSAINKGGEGEKTIELVGGKILADFPQQQTPYKVLAGDIWLSSYGGRFVVEKDADHISVASAQGAGQVGLRNKINEHYENFRAGEALTYTNERFSRGLINTELALAWTRMLLIANDRTVADIVQNIRPYFTGVIRVSDAAAKLRASGVFRLDDPASSVQALTKTLDLSYSSIGGYWITIDVSV